MFSICQSFCFCFCLRNTKLERHSEPHSFITLSHNYAFSMLLVRENHTHTHREHGHKHAISHTPMMMMMIICRAFALLLIIYDCRAKRGAVIERILASENTLAVGGVCVNVETEYEFSVSLVICLSKYWLQHLNKIECFCSDDRSIIRLVFVFRTKSIKNFKNLNY